MGKFATDEERRRLVARWRASGQSVRNFATKHGVGISTFYEWSRRFPNTDETGFTEVEIVQRPDHSNATSGIELELAGVVVRVGANVQSDALRRVLEVLRSC